jgi:hypothetical protein
MTQELTLQERRTRRLLPMTPVILLPFFAIFFYAFGGGKGDPKTDLLAKKGFDTQLPAAQVRDSRGMDKMSFYQQAEKDSIERIENEQKGGDSLGTEADGDSVGHPLNKRDTMGDKGGFVGTGEHPTGFSQGYGGPATGRTIGMDENEAKVYGTISKLNEALHAPRVGPSSGNGFPYDEGGQGTLPTNGLGQSQQIAQLKKTLEELKSTQKEDPEMMQINGALDKLIQVQHPEYRADSLQARSLKDKSVIYPVRIIQDTAVVSVLVAPGSRPSDTTSARPTGGQGGFFGPDQPESGINPIAGGNAIAAEIDETKTLVTGATVKLRLSDAFYLGGLLVPSGTEINGKASLSGDRLQIRVSSIRVDNSILRVDLEVYDYDGQVGLYIPDAISRTVAKESISQAAEGVDIGSYSPTIGGQAASAGVEAAKTLLSRKVQLIQVSIKAGIPVLLKEIK